MSAHDDEEALLRMFPAGPELLAILFSWRLWFHGWFAVASSLVVCACAYGLKHRAVIRRWRRR